MAWASMKAVQGNSMAGAVMKKWVRFLRNYGPIPTNDNMYDEMIWHALRKHKIEPLNLPAPYLEELLENFKSDNPVSEILTGTAGDGKTYRCREVWLNLGGREDTWLRGDKRQTLQHGGREIVFIKDLSELRAEDSTPLLQQMAEDVALPDARRVYLVAANHGQLLEKLKLASDSTAVARMATAVEEMLFRKTNPDPGLRLRLFDLSRSRATLLVGKVIEQVTDHPGWQDCETCPVLAAGQICPIQENRARLKGDRDKGLLRTRLEALIEICAQNGVHLPVRQLLLLVANAVLGHPAARDGLMTCEDVPRLIEAGDVARASVYRNIFGENLSARRADQTDVFRKLNAFGIGVETSNAVDNLLVYGADDPKLKDSYQELVGRDTVYGATPAYAQAQQAYLESYDGDARLQFLELLQGQRQRLFFTLPERHVVDFNLWDMTVFRHAGLFLRIFIQLHGNKPVDRAAMPLIMRGINRLSTGALLQNQDELILATSGSMSQAKRSPLLDDVISVPRQQGQEVALLAIDDYKLAIKVKVARGTDPAPVVLVLTPTRFEFLGRVAEGALPSSFSLECQEDLLAFKARLLAATARRRKLDGDADGEQGEIALRFIEVSDDGAATTHRVTVRL